MRRPAHGLARVFSAASPAARHPTFDTTRETHRASPRTQPATGPTRVGIHAACVAPRRHTMPSAQAVVKRGGGARRTSVSQSWKGTGHFVRLYLRRRCTGRGHNRRILLESGAPGRIRTCDPRLRRPVVQATKTRPDSADARRLLPPALGAGAGVCDTPGSTTTRITGNLGCFQANLAIFSGITHHSSSS